MTNTEWNAIIEEARKEEPLKKGTLKQNGVITWAAYPNGLLLVEGNGRMEFEEYYYEVNFNGYYWEFSLFQDVCYELSDDGKPIKYLYLSDGIKEIGTEAFPHVYLEELRLPNDLEIINQWAFDHTFYNDPEETEIIRCEINELRIPKSLKLLGWNSFKGIKVKKLILPDTVENLKNKLNENIKNSENLLWRYSDELPSAEEIIIEK